MVQRVIASSFRFFILGRFSPGGGGAWFLQFFAYLLLFSYPPVEKKNAILEFFQFYQPFPRICSGFSGGTLNTVYASQPFPNKSFFFGFSKNSHLPNFSSFLCSSFGHRYARYWSCHPCPGCYMNLRIFFTSALASSFVCHCGEGRFSFQFCNFFYMELCAREPQ